jgi:hypothetical protein
MSKQAPDQQPTLPAFEPPPPECPVSRDGKHCWDMVIPYMAASLYRDVKPYCTYCGAKKEVPRS